MERMNAGDRNYESMMIDWLTDCNDRAILEWLQTNTKMTTASPATIYKTSFLSG